MTRFIPIFVTAAALVYGGVIDFKRREIPNTVPIILLAVGILFGFPIFRCIMGLIAPAVLLLAAARITKSEVPGGDYKLLCSLGFACGLFELAAVTLLAAVGTIAYGLVKRLPIKRHVPLCSYVAAAYIVLQVAAIALSLKGGGSI
ncbi:MAG: prepilin peptidase [Oscillospiraceae bacterium]|nr:prepilin peptidase [Oscillospiraceae bacterium]